MDSPKLFIRHSVPRRIGGLEKFLKNRGADALVPRRIGGLESARINSSNKFIVPRRIGGLEIESELEKLDPLVPRRIGGLETGGGRRWRKSASSPPHRRLRK